MRSLIVTILLVAAPAASAETIIRVCENPFREYVVTYDTAFPSIMAGDTSYKVLAVEDTPEKLVIVGLTTTDGPTYRYHLRPYMKMEFFSDGQLQQTDGCRP